MADIPYLEDLINESGKTKTYLATKLGLTLQGLNLKLNNRYKFTVDEASILCDELGVTKATDKVRIFL